MSIFDGSSTGHDSLTSANLSTFGDWAAGSFDNKDIERWISAFSQKSQQTNGDAVLIQIGASLGACLLIMGIYILISRLRDGRLILEPVDVLDDDIRRRRRGETIEDYYPMGLDSKAYRNINRTVVFISLIQASFALVLLRLDYQYNVTGEHISFSNWSHIFSIANVKGKLLYAHFGYAFIVSFSTCVGVLGSVYAMNRERQEWFDSQALRPTYLMLTGGLERWEGVLSENRIWASSVHKVKPGVKLRNRHKLTLAFNKHVRKLEQCGTAYCGLLRKSLRSKEPSTSESLHRQAERHLIRFVDRVTHLDKQYLKHEKLDASTSRWKNPFATCFAAGCCCFRCDCCRPTNNKYSNKKSNQSSNYGFLLFRDHQAARFHLKRLLVADQSWFKRFMNLFFKANVELAPEPAAISYAGITRNRTLRWWDTLRSLTFMFITILIYLILVLLISGLANLQNYVTDVAWLRKIWDWKVHNVAVGQKLITIVSGMIPPALSSAIRYMLVPVFRRWAHLRGTATFISRDKMIFVWYFAVLFMCQLVCFTLLGVVQSLVRVAFNDWVEHGFNGGHGIWIALKMFPENAIKAAVGSANYWLCSLGLQCAISAFNIVEPTRLWRIKLLPYLRGDKGQTQRELKAHHYPSNDDFPVVKDSANLMMMQAVISTYAMITPLVTIVGCVANIIYMKATTTRLRHVHRTRGEGQGHLYWLWINRLLLCAGVVQPSVCAMSLIINLGWLGIPIALVPAVCVALFKLEISYAGISNLIAGRSRRHWTGWSLEDTYWYGKEVKEQVKYLDKKEKAKRHHVDALELAGHPDLLKHAEIEVKRRLNKGANDIGALQGSLAEKGYDVGELIRAEGQPSEELFNRYTALDLASDYEKMRLDNEELADHIHALIEVLAMEARLQPIDMDDEEDVRGCAYPPKEPPNFLRPTMSVDECQIRDNKQHTDPVECRRVCRVNTFMERPSFSKDDFYLLQDGFAKVWPKDTILKWESMWREVRLSSTCGGDLSNAPLDIVRAKICEVWQVQDSDARPPYSQ